VPGQGLQLEVELVLVLRHGSAVNAQDHRVAFPATKPGGFTTKPLIAVLRLLKLIGSTAPSLTLDSHASFWT